MFKSNLSCFMEEDETQNDINNVLVIDGHNLIYRNLHVAKLHNETQDEIFKYWKHLVLSSLFGLVRKFDPDRLIFAIDDKVNWRKKVYSEYKAHRKIARDKSAIDFKQFYVVMEEFLNEIQNVFSNMFFLKINNAEGDDIIAVIAKHIKDSQVTIVSNDGDFVQLMKQKNINIWNPLKRKMVKCINPHVALELKIIMGDKSDNITAIKPAKNAKFMGDKPAMKMMEIGIDKYLKEKDVKERYLRNKQLIDLDYIPEDLTEKIKKQYNDYEITELNGRKVWEFLTKNRLSHLSENLQVNIPFLKQLN